MQLDLPTHRPPRILIIKPSSLGDIVHALPVLAALRHALPDARISWLINRSFASLLEQHPLLDEVIVFDRKTYGKMHARLGALSAFAGFVADLRRRRFDIVLDLQGLYRSGFLALASGAPQRIGFSATREFAGLHYSRRIATPSELTHAVDRNVAFARGIGLAIDSPDFPLALSQDEAARAGALIEHHGGAADAAYLAVIPGARWRTKLWDPTRLAASANEARDALPARGNGSGRPLQVVLLGAPDETEISARVAADLDGRVIDLTGKTNLRELTAVIAGARAVLCHDSGPMHIAAALNVPTVAIFGPTDPKRCGPYSPVARVVGTAIECRGCYLRECGHHSCMRQLSVTDVAGTLADRLRQSTSTTARR